MLSTVAQKLLLAVLGSLLLLFAIGCGGADGSALGEDVTLSGHIDNWLPSDNLTALSAQIGQTRFRGTIDGGGRFTLPLPSRVTGLSSPFATIHDPAIHCTSLPMVSPASLLLGTLEIYTESGLFPSPALLQSNFAPGTAASAGGVVVNYLYSDQDGSVSGHHTCTRNGEVSQDARYNLTLQRGWNAALWTPAGADAAAADSAPPPADARWYIAK